MSVINANVLNSFREQHETIMKLDDSAALHRQVASQMTRGLMPEVTRADTLSKALRFQIEAKQQTKELSTYVRASIQASIVEIIETNNKKNAKSKIKTMNLDSVARLTYPNDPTMQKLFKENVFSGSR